jgi:hypothetical protein
MPSKQSDILTIIRPSSLLSYTSKTDCIIKYLLDIIYCIEKQRIEPHKGSFQALVAICNLFFGKLAPGGKQVWVNHLIEFDEPMNKLTYKPIFANQSMN